MRTPCLDNTSPRPSKRARGCRVQLADQGRQELLHTLSDITSCNACANACASCCHAKRLVRPPPTSRRRFGVGRRHRPRRRWLRGGAARRTTAGHAAPHPTTGRQRRARAYDRTRALRRLSLGLHPFCFARSLHGCMTARCLQTADGVRSGRAKTLSFWDVGRCTSVYPTVTPLPTMVRHDAGRPSSAARRSAARNCLPPRRSAGGAQGTAPSGGPPAARSRPRATRRPNRRGRRRGRGPGGGAIHRPCQPRSRPRMRTTQTFCETAQRWEQLGGELETGAPGGRPGGRRERRETRSEMRPQFRYTWAPRDRIWADPGITHWYCTLALR